MTLSAVWIFTACVTSIFYMRSQHPIPTKERVVVAQYFNERVKWKTINDVTIVGGSGIIYELYDDTGLIAQIAVQSCVKGKK